MTKKAKPLGRNKRKVIMHKMTTVDFFPYRTVEKDSNMIAFAERIKEKTGINDGRFMLDYSERLTYTEAMKFDWSIHPDVPDHVKTVETWWNMVDSGESESDCYVFYRKNIGWDFTAEYEKAITEVHKTWKPAKERDDREDENTDPNS